MLALQEFRCFFPLCKHVSHNYPCKFSSKSNNFPTLFDNPIVIIPIIFKRVLTSRDFSDIMYTENKYNVKEHIS